MVEFVEHLSIATTFVLKMKQSKTDLNMDSSNFTFMIFKLKLAPVNSKHFDN